MAADQGRAADDVTGDLERAVIYTPQHGDVVVLEVPLDTFSPAQADQLKHQAEEVFGHDVKIAVLGGVHFAGVVREGGDVVLEMDHKEATNG